MFRPNRYLTALACALLLSALACGQKPGVADQFAGGVLPAGASVNEQGEIVDADGNVIGNTGDLSGSGSFDSSAVGGDTSGGTVGGTTDSTTGGTTGDGTTGGTTGGGTTGGGATSTGVTDD